MYTYGQVNDKITSTYNTASYVNGGYISNPERIESQEQLNTNNVPQGCIKFAKTYIPGYQWGVSITMNIDDVFLQQLFFGENTVVTRRKNLADGTWTGWTSH